jgi:hypothetical protein
VFPLLCEDATRSGREKLHPFKGTTDVIEAVRLAVTTRGLRRVDAGCGAGIVSDGTAIGVVVVVLVEMDVVADRFVPDDDVSNWIYVLGRRRSVIPFAPRRRRYGCIGLFAVAAVFLRRLPEVASGDAISATGNPAVVATPLLNRIFRFTLNVG